MYTITRQIQWPEGKPVVEISYGGIDYCNPDALVEEYRGEFEEYKNPKEAVKTAIEICKLWRKDGKKEARIGIGATGGMTMPFETCSFKEAIKWAGKEYKSLEKCQNCGSIMGKEKWSTGFITKRGDFISDGEYIYCSQNCAEKELQYEE